MSANEFVKRQSCGETGPNSPSSPQASEPSALAVLLARVEAANGPDRELDAAIYCAIFPEYGEVGVYPFETEPGLYWRLPARGSTPKRAPLYTASLDASLALCERVLPSWEYALSGGPETGDTAAWARATITTLMWPKTEAYHSLEAATPALALLAALLKAKIAEAASPAERPALPGDDQQ